MAVSPLGNIIQVHQNMTAQATKQANFQSRVDLQDAFANAAANEKSKEVKEVRPTEEIYKIDPEREHEKDRNEQEQQASEHTNKEKKENEQEEEGSSSHHLDIKI